MSELELSIGGKVIGSVTITGDGDFISEANKTSDKWVEQEITLELLSDNSELESAIEVMDAVDKISKSREK